MSVSIQSLGTAGYKIVTQSGKHIVIDPFLPEDSEYFPVKTKDLGKVDLLLISHNAFDHFGDAAEVIKEYGCHVVCAGDVSHNLIKYYNIDKDLIIQTIWGIDIGYDDLTIHPIESKHWSLLAKDDGNFLSGPCLSFIIEIDENTKIYHSADTTLFSDMKLIGQIYKPTIGLMDVPHKLVKYHFAKKEELHVTWPSTGHKILYKCGELTPETTLLASEWLGLKQVIVSNYIELENEDVKKFVRLVEENKKNGKYAPETHVLKAGETVEL